jgi:hypothetical protein
MLHLDPRCPDPSTTTPVTGIGRTSDDAGSSAIAQRSKGRIRLMEFSPHRSNERSIKKPCVALLPFA